MHYIETDSKTSKLIGLSEVERRHQHVKKLTECLGDLHLQVRQCLDNEQMKCPQIVTVAEKMRSMKEAEILTYTNVILSNHQRVSPDVSFPVNVKELNYSNDYILTVNPKWNISQVKEAISARHHKQLAGVFWHVAE